MAPMTSSMAAAAAPATVSSTHTCTVCQCVARSDDDALTDDAQPRERSADRREPGPP